MSFELLHPRMLFLLPVALLAVIFFARDIRTRSKSRRVGLTLMRCVVVSLAVLAMCGVSVSKRNDMTTTIFLVDLSDSMQQAEGEEAEFVRDAIARMSAKEQAGIVAFGSDVQIEQFVSDKKIFTEIQSKINGTATNLEQAVTTALALYPEGSAKRLVLLTDGAENEGTVENLVHAVTEAEVECKVVSYDSSVANEVYVSDVTLPKTIHQGDTFQVQVEVYATDPGPATISLYSGRTLKGQRDVELQKGYNKLVFSDTGVEGGLKSYRVTVEAERDTVSVNNTYSAYTTVESRTRVLLVEGQDGQADTFRGILEACNYDYDVVTPSGVPNQISELNQYQTVILLDVYIDDFRNGFLETLEKYVKDYAGGLITIGGENSYALGNYKDTILEDVLPVSMELEGEKQLPKLAMAMVIDHSGSMDSPASERSSISCMEVAKNAAVRALDSLREIDEVGVLAFDDTYDWAVPMQDAKDIDGITNQIAGIQALGGTSIYPALQEAVAQLKRSDASLKHMILLTDGQDGFHEYEDVLESMGENNITLSTVAIGTGADTKIMKFLAERGNGRYYYSDAGSKLPRIFAQEVYLSSKSYLINDPFVPTLVNSHDILGDIFDGGSPELYGYIATTPKSTSTVLLESDKGDPVLAVWQCGLGKSIAWTSDGTNQWTGAFAAWDGYVKLWRNMIDWTISDSDLGSDTLEVAQQANSIVVTYETEEYTADTKISAVMTDEDGEQTNFTLKATSPGIYKAEVPLDKTGVFSINVRNQKGQEIVKNINTAAVMQYSREYRYAQVQSSMAQFLEDVKGRIITDPAEVYDTKLQGAVARKDLTQLLITLALLLFVLDIVARRLCLDWVALITNQAIRIRKAAKNQTMRSARERKGRQSRTALSDASEENLAGSLKAGLKNAETAAGYSEPRPANDNKAKKNQSADVIDTAALLKKKQDRNMY